MNIKTLLLLIVSMSFIVASGQILDSIWYHTYEYNGWDEIPSTITETYDGGFLIGGSVGYPAKDEDDFDAYLLKIDKDGYKLWSKTYGQWDLQDGISHLQKTTDSCYIVTGYTARPTTGYSQAWLLKIDKTGDTIWTKTYQKSLDNGAKCVTETSDGGFAIIGSYGWYGSGSKIYLIKTDNVGDTLWTKEFEKDLYNIGNCIKETSDSGLFIVAQTFNLYPNNNWNIYIIKTNSVGDTIWTRYIDNESSDYIADMITDNDTAYLIGTSYFNNTINVNTIKITSSGDIIWNNHFEIESSSGAYTGRFAFNGSLLIGGWSCEYNSYANIYLLKISEQGEFLWSKTFDSDYTQSVKSIALTSDNGYILTGETTTDYMRGDVFAMKAGYETTGITDFPNNYNSSITLFPNPTGNMSSYSFELKQNSFVNLSVHDASGRIVISYDYGEMNVGVYKIGLDFSDLKDGIYFINTFINNESYTEKIILAR